MNELYELKSLGAVKINNDIWFPNRFFNALIKMDAKSGKIRDIKKFPNYEAGETVLYTTVLYAYDKLIFVPGRSEEIVSYCVESEKFVSVSMDLNIVGEEKLYFWCAYVNGQYVYMFPRKAKCIVKYNVLDNSIMYLENYLNEIIRVLPENVPCFSAQFEIVNGKVYIPFVELNAVMVFDAKDESIEIKYINIEGGCTTITYVNEYFYLASLKNSCVFQWEINSGKIKRYDMFNDEIKLSSSVEFFYAHRVEKRLFYYSIDGKTVVSLFLEDGGEKRTDGKFKIHNTGITSCLRRGDGDKNYVLIPCIEDFCLKKDEYGIDEAEIASCQDNLHNKAAINNYLMEQEYFHGYLETRQIPLETYTEALEYTKEKEKKEKTAGYGQLIFNKIKDLC